jgi:hypothetical protein
MAKLKSTDPTLFKPAAYGQTSSVLMNYHPGAPWTWLACEQEEPGIIFYNDV